MSFDLVNDEDVVALTRRSTSVLARLTERLVWPAFVCIVGPRRVGKTELASGVVACFCDDHPRAQVYIACNGDEVYSDLARRSDRIHCLPTHAWSAREAFFRGPLLGVDANTPCLFVLDFGFMCHQEQRAVHAWTAAHPAASVVAVEYLWPEPVLIEDVTVMCQWSRTARRTETGGGGFSIFPLSRDAAQSLALRVDASTDAEQGADTWASRWSGATIDADRVWITLDEIVNWSVAIYRDSCTIL